MASIRPRSRVATDTGFFLAALAYMGMALALYVFLGADAIGL